MPGSSSACASWAFSTIGPGGGEYLHVYGESFADRFFFEIVQRVGDYEGYGALNAPARMASQAQAEQAEAARQAVARTREPVFARGSPHSTGFETGWVCTIES